MNAGDKTAPSQTESISFEFDLHHSPEKVWRALTDPVLLAEWLLPVVEGKLEPGAAFTFTGRPCDPYSPGCVTANTACKGETEVRPPLERNPEFHEPQAHRAPLLPLHPWIRDRKHCVQGERPQSLPPEGEP